VAAKQEVIGHVDDVEFVVGVESAQRVEHLHFNERLVMKTARRHYQHLQQQQQQNKNCYFKIYELYTVSLYGFNYH